MTAIISKDKVFILAEVAQSYEGNIDTLVKISEGACRAGVDGVMFQVVFADELAVPEHSCYKLFKSMEMPKKSWKRVIDAIHCGGKLAVGEIFGEQSVSLMLGLGIDMFKIHAADISNHSLLHKVGGTKLPVLLAAGGGYNSEIKHAINALKEGGAEEIVLLHGYQMCPTSIKDSHLNKIKSLEEAFGLPVGYSDHIAGCIDNKVEHPNEMAHFFPLIAVGAGAKLVEKHIILDRTKSWEDYESALTASEFEKFVKLIRECESSLGTKDLSSNEAEAKYRTRAIKYIVAARDISKGTVISEEMVFFKRISNPEEGIPHMKDVIGRRLLEDLRKNAPVRRGAVAYKEEM